MKRRNFLRTSAAAIATATVGGEQIEGGEAKAESAPPPRPAAAGVPRVLITAAESPLARPLADGLAGQYRVRLAGKAFDGRHEFVPADLGELAPPKDLVRGMDAIVHLTQASQVDEAGRIDACTRGTYNLLTAAAEEGVRRMIYLSSLDMMTAYDADFEVTEDWRPLPRSGSGGLAEYLGEYTCREFAREGKLQIVVLRLGRLAQPEEKAPDPLAIGPRDVLEAVSLALAALFENPRSKLGPWSVFHIGPDGRQARFSIANARRVLGYRRDGEREGRE